MHDTPETAAGEVISEAPPVNGQEAVREMPAREAVLPAGPRHAAGAPGSAGAPAAALQPPGLCPAGHATAPDREEREARRRRRSHRGRHHHRHRAAEIRLARERHPGDLRQRRARSGRSRLGLDLHPDPLWIGIGAVVCAVAKFSAERRRQYQAWKASLTPEERAWVNAAEAAAAVAATAEMIHRAREMDRKNSVSAMGWNPRFGDTPEELLREKLLADHMSGARNHGR
jgi:hypothetical protein